MKRWLVGYVAIAAVFLALDATWLTFTSATVYRPALGPILASSPRLVPAALFYLIYFAGLMSFAVRPALEFHSWRHAGARGAAFGICAYATYDLTNQATLAVWSTRVTALDLAWGAAVSAAGAAAGFLAASRIKPAR